MLPVNDLFTAKDKEAIYSFLDTYPRYLEILEYRKLPPRKVKTVFYGDSITNAFPLQEFFPGASFLNRGIGGDNVNGLYFRLEDDVFPFHPEQVVMMIGINGIAWEFGSIVAKIARVAELIAERGSRVYLCSILPLRNPDAWNRFQYQDKIVKLNAEIKRIADSRFTGYLDYHTALRDENGELAKPFAREDGTHLTFDGYIAMAKVLEKTVPLY